jgi:hypothetical protein
LLESAANEEERMEIIQNELNKNWKAENEPIGKRKFVSGIPHI